MLLEKLDRWEHAKGIYNDRRAALEQAPVPPPPRGKSDQWEETAETPPLEGPGTEAYAKWRMELAEARLGQLRCYDALGDIQAQVRRPTRIFVSPPPSAPSAVDFLGQMGDYMGSRSAGCRQHASEGRKLAEMAGATALSSFGFLHGSVSMLVACRVMVVARGVMF
jgi:hypothetical protein